MAYARFGCGTPASDVYVFCNVGGSLECCACSLGGDSRYYYSTNAMIAHVNEHIAAGHGVPDSLVADLEHDREENDAYIAGRSKW